MLVYWWWWSGWSFAIHRVQVVILMHAIQAGLTYCYQFVLQYVMNAVSTCKSQLIPSSAALSVQTDVSHCPLLSLSLLAPCGLRGCKNGPAPFPGRMPYKVTKPGLVSVLYLSMFFLLYWCLLGPLFMYC